MYSTQSRHSAVAPESMQEQNSDIGMLNERLAHDESGALRDHLLDELAVAAQDIEAALVDRRNAAHTEVLGNLLKAIRSSERILVQVWDSFHG
jgi:hypothetical protein